MANVLFFRLNHHHCSGIGMTDQSERRPRRPVTESPNLGFSEEFRPPRVRSNRETYPLHRYIQVPGIFQVSQVYRLCCRYAAMRLHVFFRILPLFSPCIAISRPKTMRPKMLVYYVCTTAVAITKTTSMMIMMMIIIIIIIMTKSITTITKNKNGLDDTPPDQWLSPLSTPGGMK